MGSVTINLDISIQGTSNPPDAYLSLVHFFSKLPEGMNYETLTAVGYDDIGDEVAHMDGAEVVSLAANGISGGPSVSDPNWINKTDKYPPQNEVVWVQTTSGVFKAFFTDTWQYTGWRIQFGEKGAFHNNRFKTILSWQPIKEA